MKALRKFLDYLFTNRVDASIESWRRAREDMKNLKWRSWEKRWEK